MRTSQTTELFTVIDEFLPPEEFRRVWLDVRSAEYRNVHAELHRSVFRLADGSPLEGSPAYSQVPPQGLPGRACAYPTGRALDVIFDQLFRHCSEWSSVIGAYKADWSIVTAKAHIYPPGTGLSWHGDGAGRTGAYALYVHPVWSPHWGGETLIANPREVLGFDPAPNENGDLFSTDGGVESAELLNPGTGTFVMPRPNRLLIMKAGARHRVNPVHPGSGAEMRCSVSGFFLTVAEPARPSEASQISGKR
jgi:hypothetical protein